MAGRAAAAMADGSAPAMGFDGINDQILLPGGFNDFTTGLTLEAWVYPTAGVANTPYIFLGTGQNNDVVRLGTGATAGGADLAFTVFNTTSSWGTVTAPGVLRQNQWQHVAATLSGGQATLYVDGLRVAAGTVPAPTVANRTAVWLGRAAIAGYMNGRLDEVAVYTSALSGSRVAAHYAASGRSLPVAASPAPAYQAAVVADGPVAYWRLNEAADRSVAWDLTNNGNNAVIVGGVTRGATGALPADSDTAMTLNGTTGYLAPAAGFADFTTGLTIELWVNPSTLVSGQRLVQLSKANANDEIKLFLPNANGDLAFHIYRGTAAGSTATAPGILQAGVWQHLVVTQEAVTGKVTIYRNGLRVAQGTAAVPLVAERTLNYLGRSPSAFEPFLNGGLDEVAVYTTALSGNRVAAHYAASGRSLPAAASPAPAYQAAVVADAPLAYYRLGEPVGETVAWDLAGNSTGAPIVGGVTRGAAGALAGDTNTAMTMNGTTGYLAPPAGFSDFSTGLTLEVWVNPTTLAANTRLADLSTGNNNNTIKLYVASTGGDLAYQVYQGTTAGTIVKAPGVLVAGSWQHVVVTQEAVTGKVTIYRNGLRVAQGTTLLPSNVTRTVNYLGKSQGIGEPYLNGGLDEVAVYTTALSGSRVAAHFTASGRSLPAAPTPAPAYQAAVVADAPLAYYRLGEPAGETVAWDQAGNTTGAPIVGGVTRGAVGGLPAETDTAMTLDGTTGYLAPPAGFNDFSTGLTLELWVNPTTLATNTRLVDLSVANSNNTIKLFVSSTTGDLAYQVYQGTTAGAQVKALSVLTTSAWQHLVVTQAPSGVVTIYRNGLRVAQGSTLLPSAVTRTANFLGRSAFASDPYFSGSLDEVAVYTTALSGSRVAAHYTASGRSLPQAPTPAPVYQAAVVADAPLAYYRLSEPAGETVAWDLAGNTTGAPIVGGVTKGAVGALAGDTNTAMTLNGTTGYLTMPSGFAVGDASGVTIELWANPSAVQGLSRLIELSNGSSSDAIALFRNGSSNDVGVRVYRGGTVGATVTAPNALVLNTWTHLVATIDSVGAVKIYVNGALAGSGATAIPAAVTRNQNYLGRSAWGGEYWYAGSLDEVAVYGKVLSAGQVLTHYHWGTVVEAPSAYRDLVLSSNPSGYWRLTDGSGVAAAPQTGETLSAAVTGCPGALFDRSGAGAILTPVGGVTCGVAGPLLNEATAAIRLDGVDGHLTVPQGLFDSFGTGFSVSAWIYPTEAPLFARVIDVAGAGNQEAVIFSRAGTGSALTFHHWSLSGSGWVQSADGVLQLNQWQHVAMTLDPSGVVKLYHNGVVVAEGVVPVPSTRVRDSNFVGRSNNPHDGYYKGSMAEVTVYKRLLSAVELQGQLQEGRPDKPCSITIGGRR